MIVPRCSWDLSFPLKEDLLVVDEEQYRLLIAELCLDRTLSINPAQKVLITRGHFSNRIELTGALAGVEFEKVRPADSVAELSLALADGFQRHLSRTSEELTSLWHPVSRNEESVAMFGSVLRLLLDLYAFLENAFLSCAVSFTNVTASRRGHWWLSKPAITLDIERWRSRIRTEISLGRNLKSFLDHLNDIHSVLKNLERREAGNLREVLASASAVCFVSGEVLMARGMGSVALMLGNRASEYLLAAVAYEAGLAQETISGLTLAGSNVGLSSLINLLVDSGTLNRKFKDGHIFKSINTARNQLSFTHGLSAIALHEAEVAMSDLRVELKGLDPTLGWWAKVVAVRPWTHNALPAIADAMELNRWVEKRDGVQIAAEVASIR